MALPWQKSSVVIEQQAGYRDALDVGKTSGRRDVLQGRVGRMEGERNKRLEAACLILKIAELEQVVHAVFV